MITSAMVSMGLVTCLGVPVGWRMTVSAAERGDGAAQGRLVMFDIPAQPLASALEAYGEATGLGVFYEATLAAAHWSPGVRGSFAPARGLDVLLRGTGYAQRATGPATISIVPAPQYAPQKFVASKRASDRYGAYLAVLQKRLSQVLCRSDHAGPAGSEIVFRFWLAASGLVTRADIIESGGDPERDRVIAKGLEGFNVGEPPPVGLPEPIIMTVFPPAEGEVAECPAGHDGGGEH